MKILTKGINPKKYTPDYTIYCRCGCTFEFDLTDKAIYVKKDKLDRPIFFIKCPNCQSEFHVRRVFNLSNL